MYGINWAQCSHIELFQRSLRKCCFIKDSSLTDFLETIEIWLLKIVLDVNIDCF